VSRPLLPQQVVPFDADPSQRRRDEAVDALRGELAAKAMLKGRLITGERDDAAPTGLTDGIAFTAPNAKVIDHGLGEECAAWIEVPMAGQTTRPSLTPAHATGIDLDKQIRVTPANTSRCWLFVIPRSAVTPR